ncbi:MAG TPA: hypothetical protein VM364_03840 [Vicinamibacterales bacterium]|nr:hypothetical protein [Vicinamibacterales bacterium]
MSTAAFVLLAALAAGLVYWFPICAWYRRSDARRLANIRAMSGDTEILVPDYESTLAISVEAPPAAVWEALLRFGWPIQDPYGSARGAHAMYEWLGRAGGFLIPAGHGNDAAATAIIPLGRTSGIPVRSVDPVRGLVVGATAGVRRWRWQFEISRLDERRTRVILRDSSSASSRVPAWLRLAIPRALSFVLTRKMLLDIKTAAEATTVR